MYEKFSIKIKQPGNNIPENNNYDIFIKNINKKIKNLEIEEEGTSIFEVTLDQKKFKKNFENLLEAMGLKFIEWGHCGREYGCSGSGGREEGEDQ